MEMQFEYGVGYDGQQSISVGYTFTGPLGVSVASTFQSTDAAVLAKAEELIALICSTHTLTRKTSSSAATPAPVDLAAPVDPTAPAAPAAPAAPPAA